MTSAEHAKLRSVMTGKWQCGKCIGDGDDQRYCSEVFWRPFNALCYGGYGDLFNDS